MRKRLSVESLEGRLLLAADYGDAPDTYGTLTTSNGPSHATAAYMLGVARDLEANGTPSAGADGDGSDDDGVTFSALRAGGAALVSVYVTNPTSTLLEIDAWIDFDGDGAFSGALERIFAAKPVDPGRNDFELLVPSWAAAGVTYARFRLSASNVSPIGPLGNGGPGEVEDYAIEILAPNASEGAFVEKVIANGAKGATALLPVDLDGDGDLDLVANDYNRSGITWHRNDGLGNFTQQFIVNSSLGYSGRFLAGDRNNDGLLDLLAIEPGASARWLTQSSLGSPGFGATSLEAANAAIPVDLYRDGVLDTLVAGPNPNVLKIFGNSNTTLTTKFTGTKPATAVDAGDIDGDGDVDFVVGSAADNTLAWYEFSAPSGYTRRVLSTEVAGISSASLLDFDGDGDRDVLTYSATDGRIDWFENDGTQNFTRHLIATISGVAEITRADVDADGDLDLLVAAGAAGAKLLTNDGGGTYVESTLPTTASVPIQSIVAGDFDGDGILELAVSGANPSPGGTGYLALLRRSTELDFGDAPASYGTKLAGDGARHYPAGPTLGATRDGELDGGSPSADDGADEDGVAFGTLQIGDNSATAIVNIQNAPAGAKLDAWIDFNGDGYFDSATERIVSSASVTQGENVLQFSIPVTATAGATYARFRLSTTGGLGPKGGASDGEVEDYAVTIASPGDGGGRFGAGSIISANSWETIVVAVDFDRDGDLDVFTAGSGITWYANDGAGKFTRVNSVIPTVSSPVDSLDAIDLDGDGDLDLVGRSSGSLFWNENLGGGLFRMQIISSTAVSGALPPAPADFDADGDIDFVIASPQFLGLQLLENVGGRFVLRTLNLVQQTPNVPVYRASALAVVDADSDGDLDIYLAPEDYSARLVLYRNDGQGNLTPSILASEPGYTGPIRAHLILPADVDGDGDDDLIVTRQNGSSYASYTGSYGAGWYENLGGGTVLYRPIKEIEGQFYELTAGDLDGDGDIDLVATYTSFGRTIWHENLGNGRFSARLLSSYVATYSQAINSGLTLGDVDGDGKLDVITASDRNLATRWTRQLAAAPGDYGDAPQPYPVSPSADGPVHAAVGPRLGDGRDEETSATNSTAGEGDGDDDDGVVIAPFRVGELGVTATINVQNAPAGARLDAWIDFDGDGNWSRAEERIAANLAVVEGDNVVRFNVPAWAMAGVSYARFRVSSAGQLGFVGAAADGEVEDHAVTILNPTAATGPYFEQHLIAESLLGGMFFVADIDRDGDNDVIRGTGINVVMQWYENDGSGQFTVRTLPGTVNWQAGLFDAVDFDGDGDLDIVNQSSSGSQLLWFENDGQQAFIRRSISLSGSRLARYMSVVDVEGDGDLDILNPEAWSQRTGPATFVTYPQTSYLSPFAGYAAVDLNQDGHLDLLHGSSSASRYLSWSRFSPDQFKLGVLTPISSIQASAVSAADMDRDGDLDLLMIGYGGLNNVIWLENDGRMNYTERVIGSLLGSNLNNITAADVDGDGDLDVVAPGVFFENDGNQKFAARTTGAPLGDQMTLADMNGDGKLDLVTNPYYINEPARTGISWYSLTDRQVAVTAAPSTVDEEGTESVVFTFTRAGATEGELTVPFTVGGNALYGVDYTVSGAATFDAVAGTITFAAGVTMAQLTVTPLDDAEKELHERVTLTIPLLPGYSLASAVATATIRTAEFAGDYDDNGTVDGADFLAWQRSFGLSADPVGGDADGNRDGEIDSDDLTIWADNFGQTAVVALPAEPVVAALLAAEETSALTLPLDEQASGDQSLTAPTTPWYGHAAAQRTPLFQTSAADSTPAQERRQRPWSRERVADESFAQGTSRLSRWGLEPSASGRFSSTADSAAVDAAFGEERGEDGDWECFDEAFSVAGALGN